jgi:hypothetical protein
MFSWIWFFVERFLQVEALDNRVFFSTGRPENSVYLGKELVVDRKTKKKKKLVKGDFRIQHENLHKIVQHKNGVSSLVASAYNVVSCDYDGIVSVASVWDSKRKVFSKSCGEEV